MKACIYTRTSRAEKGVHTTSIPNQVEFCTELARRHNLAVRHDHIFSDAEIVGTAMPTCWASDDDEVVRPGLSALVEAIEGGGIDRVLVRRPEKLGTSYDVLHALRTFFESHGVRVIIPPRDGSPSDADPRATFAVQTLGPVIQFETALDEERRAKLRARKLEELERLRDRVARLEAEIAGL